MRRFVGVTRIRACVALLVLRPPAWPPTSSRPSPPWFERLRYPLHYSAIVRERARAEGLDPALLAAVIYQESKFRPDARSSSGAIGLMQLTPSTAEGIALRTGGTAFHVSDLTDPAINIRYGTWYLHDLFAKYGDGGPRARRLQRRPGQRRPLAPRRRGHPVPGDARLRLARRAPEASTARPGARSSTRAPRARRHTSMQMRVSAKADYAIRAMIELAAAGDGPGQGRADLAVAGDPDQVPREHHGRPPPRRPRRAASAGSRAATGSPGLPPRSTSPT